VSAVVKTEAQLALAGMLATASAIGLSRFGYTPLFPVMVNEGSLTAGTAGLAGALNLFGYLGGVVLGRPIGRRSGTPRALDTGMALATIAFIACAMNLGIWWFSIARFIAGFAGGILMAVAGPAVQAETAPERRGAAAGIVLGGMGLGAVVVSFLVPAMLQLGTSAAWLGLAATAAAFGIVAHPRWPTTSPSGPPVGFKAVGGKAAWGLIILYFLAGSGSTATYVYTVELAVHARNMSSMAGFVSWILFGAGGMIGGRLGGRASDLYGASFAMRASLIALTGALGLILVPYAAAHIAATFLSGMSILGIVACALARSREIAGTLAGVVWTRATAAYAVAQSSTAFALAYVYGRWHACDDIFALCLIPTAIAAVLAFPLLGNGPTISSLSGATRAPIGR
jgi:predicted MFS family arabinose efflux permease